MKELRKVMWDWVIWVGRASALLGEEKEMRKREKEKKRDPLDSTSWGPAQQLSFIQNL